MSTPDRPKGAGILDLHPAADTLLAALRIQVRTGRLVRPGQLPLESPCPGWSVRDVLNHSIGVPLECTDDLWQAGLEAARAVIGPGRDPRQYAPEIPVTAAASPRQRFLAFTGRAEPC